MCARVRGCVCVCVRPEQRRLTGGQCRARVCGGLAHEEGLLDATPLPPLLLLWLLLLSNMLSLLQREAVRRDVDRERHLRLDSAAEAEQCKARLAALQRDLARSVFCCFVVVVSFCVWGPGDFKFRLRNETAVKTSCLCKLNRSG